MTAPASDPAGPRASAPRDDLLASPVFLAACKMWEADGRAPLEFADWLRDRGFEGEADAWEWGSGYRPGVRYFSPDKSLECGFFVWCDGDDTHPSLPKEFRPRGCRRVFGGVFRDTFAEIVLWFLSRWAVVRAADGGDRAAAG
jgi:hypothetical protein